MSQTLTATLLKLANGRSNLLEEERGSDSTRRLEIKTFLCVGFFPRTATTPPRKNANNTYTHTQHPHPSPKNKQTQSLLLTANL